MPTLKELRNNAQLTQEELAAKAVISRYTITRIELGIYQPGPHVIKSLIKALKVRRRDIEFPDKTQLKDMALRSEPKKPLTIPPIVLDEVDLIIECFKKDLPFLTATSQLSKIELADYFNIKPRWFRPFPNPYFLSSNGLLAFLTIMGWAQSRREGSSLESKKLLRQEKRKACKVISDFSREVRYVRTQKIIKRQELARCLNVDLSTITKWELGVHVPKSNRLFFTIHLWARALQKKYLPAGKGTDC